MQRTILLTATVNPSNIPCVGNASERREEYLSAIKFYMTATTLPIVIVDNSGYDFHRDIPASDRFEALHFQGIKNNRGKGWGELQIIKYAFEHSSFIKETQQIVKITGRHIILNINALLAHCNNTKDVYADSNIQIVYTHSYLFCCPPIFLKENMFKKHHLMNDTHGSHFEHVLALSIREWRKYGYFHQFLYPIAIEGHPGASHTRYVKPSVIRYLAIFTKYILTEIQNIFI